MNEDRHTQLLQDILGVLGAIYAENTKSSDSKESKKGENDSSGTATIIENLSKIDVIKNATSSDEINSTILCINMLADTSTKLNAESVRNMEKFLKLFGTDGVSTGLKSLMDSLASVDIKNASLNLKGVVDLLNIFINITDAEAKKLKKTLPKLSVPIAELLEALSKVDTKPATINMKGVTDLLAILASITVMSAVKISLFGPRIGESLAEVISAMAKVKTTPVIDNMKPFIELVAFLASLEKHQVKNIKKGTKALTKAYKNGIADFIEAVAKAADEFDPKKSGAAGKFLLHFSSFMAVLIKLGPFKAKMLKWGLHIVGDTIVDFVKQLSKIDSKTLSIKFEGLEKVFKQLNRTVLLLAGLLVVTVAIAALVKIETLGKALLMYAVLIGSVVAVIYVLKKMKPSEAKAAAKTIDSFSNLLGKLSLLALGAIIVAAVIKNEILYKAFAIYGALVVTCVALMWALIAITKKGSGKDARKAIEAFSKLLNGLTIIAVIMIGIAAIASDEVLGKAAAIYFTLVVSALAVFFILSKIPKPQIKNADMAIKGMMMLFGGLTIVAIIAVMIAALVKWETLGKAAVIYFTIIITGMIMLRILASEAFSKKNIANAMVGVAAMVMLIAALTVLALVAVAIGASVKWETLGKAAMIYFAVILTAWAIMEMLIRMSNRMEKGVGKDIFFMLAGVAVILIATAFLAFKIAELGKTVNWGDFAKGGSMVLAIIAVAGGMLFALIKLSDKLEEKTGINKAYASLAIFAACMALIWWATKIGKSIDDLGKQISLKSVTKGGLLVTAVIGGCLLIMKALSKFPKSILKDIAIGLAIMGGIGALIWVLSKTLTPYFNMMKLTDTVTWGMLGNGSAKVLAVLTGVGAIALGMGALMLTPAGWFLAAGLAIGLGLIASIALVSTALSTACTKYMNLIKEVNNFDTSMMERASKIIFTKGDPSSILGSLIEMATAITDNTPSLWKMIKGMMLIKMIDMLMNPIAKFVDICAKLATQQICVGFDKDKNPIYKSFNLDDFEKAANILTTSFVKFVTDLTTGFKDVEARSAFMIGLIAHCMKPMMSTLSMFVNVVAQLAKRRIVSAYDKDGNPVFTSFTFEDFGNAASTLSDAFIAFVKALTEGFKTVDYWSMNTVRYVGHAMKPLMSNISPFVAMMTKLINSHYIEGYDENGKPIYSNERITLQDYKDAADTLATSFATFVTILSDRFKNIHAFSVIAIKWIGDSMKPLMASISPFINAMYRIINGHYIEGYDSKGKPIYSKNRITKEDWVKAALTITTCFLTFVVNLKNKLAGMSKESAEIIKMMGEGLNPIFQSLGDFVNLLSLFMDPSKMYKVTGYTRDGKPIYSNEKVDPLKAAESITLVLNEVISGVCDTLKALTDTETAAENAEEMSKTVKSVADMIKEITDVHGKIKDAEITPDTIKTNIGDVLDAFIVEIARINDKKNELMNTIEALSMVSTVDNTSSPDFSPIMSYLKVYVAGMCDLEKQIKDATGKETITTAAQAIRDSIDTFTKLDMPAAAAAAAEYASKLATSNNQVVKTNNVVIRSFNNVNKAHQYALRSLKNLDTYLKDSKDERKRTLEEMADQFKSIAEQLESMNTNMQNLKTNLEQYKEAARNIPQIPAYNPNLNGAGTNNNSAINPTLPPANTWPITLNNNNDNTTPIIVEFKDTQLKGLVRKPFS